MSRDAAPKKSKSGKKPAATVKPAKPAKPAKPEKPEGWFARLMRLDFGFRRRGASSHPLLEDPVAHIAQIKREAAVAKRSGSTESIELSAALKSVLDRHASSRSVLAHLGLLEKALGKRGLKAFDDLPQDVLQRAMSQLDTLVSDWSAAPLAALRARLKSALLKRERAGDRRSTAERLSDAGDDARVQVDEISVTTFMEANAQWEQSLTGSLKVDTPRR